jgi:8-oxo-dGTP diphosphatase
MGKKDQGIGASSERYQVVPRTLSFMLHGDDILLLKGAPSKRLWANQYNGLGGHVERGEDVRAAALREICEETGWNRDDVDDLCLRALVHVDAGDPETGIILFVFTGTACTRQTQASSEGTLEWVPRAQLQNRALVEDLPVLLPRVLSSEDDEPFLHVHYSYDQNDELIIRFNDDTCQPPFSRL